MTKRENILNEDTADINDIIENMKIVVIVMEKCQWCEKTLKYINENNINIEIIDYDTIDKESELYDALKKSYGGVPFFYCKKTKKFSYGKNHNLMYESQTKHMLEILSKKIKPKISLEDGIHTMKIISAAMKSNKLKKAILV